MYHNYYINVNELTILKNHAYSKVIQFLILFFVKIGYYYYNLIIQ